MNENNTYHLKIILYIYKENRLGKSLSISTISGINACSWHKFFGSFSLLRYNINNTLSCRGTLSANGSDGGEEISDLRAINLTWRHEVRSRQIYRTMGEGEGCYARSVTFSRNLSLKITRRERMATRAKFRYFTGKITGQVNGHN